MEVFDGQEFGLAVLEPLGAGEGLAFWTVAISAAMVRGALVAAGVTLLQVAAQSGSTAEFDGAHHAPLPARERICVLLPVRRTVAAKDIGHFEFGALHRPALRNAEVAAGFDSVATGCGSKSKGLVVEHTLLVAIRKYRAVVARLR